MDIKTRNSELNAKLQLLKNDKSVVLNDLSNEDQIIKELLEELDQLQDTLKQKQYSKEKMENKKKKYDQEIEEMEAELKKT